MATVVRIRQTWDLTFRRRRGPSDSSKTQSTRMSASASASVSSTVLRARAARFPRKPKSRLWPDDAFGRRRRCFGCKSQLGELAPVTSAVYGSLLLGGGLFAYGRSGSKGSLAGGSTGAVLMGAAYYLMQTPETTQIGYALGFGSSFLFASVFGIRLAATRKLAPAGPLLGLSVLALVVFISAYLQGTI